MSIKNNAQRLAVGILVFIVGFSLAGTASAAPSEQAAKAFDHWTNERRAAAIPRDFVIDPRGLGYLRKPGGKLQPYGHSVAALAQDMEQRGKPTNTDKTDPVIGTLNPASGQTIGDAHTFTAEISDSGSDIKSVNFVIDYPSGLTQSFAASAGPENLYSVPFSGFTNGAWNWQVIAKDNGAKGGNTASTDLTPFTVSTDAVEPPPPPPPGDAVTNAPWPYDQQDIQWAAGRIYFEMPNNRRLKRWSGYVCSGTVVADTKGGRSVLFTAAHCVYDDANGAFARNVIFIPNQDGTSGSGTDRNCSNDPIGCWYADFGVVDEMWTQSVFPNNIPYDYAYYVVGNSSDSHDPGQNYESEPTLDAAVTPMNVSFAAPAPTARTYALGYSYSEDPNFMYCAEDLSTEGSYNDWWLANCGLSGGSSGGPWVQSPDDSLDGKSVFSVNSWGYTDQPGMAGPVLYGTSASCLFEHAQTSGLGNAGVIVSVLDCSEP
ncbi:MAG: hypothetical protein V7720_12210 [Halioglobus sp.]